MASAISSVSSSSVSSPSRTTTSSGFADPTVFSNSPLLRPRVNEVEGCCANKVIINLSTSLVIPDYSLYYSGPLESFQPSFYGLDDGSLVAPPFVEDLSGANLSLLVNGILIMLFIRNIVVSGDYLRRVKIKKKTLFYILFLSQILAPISLIPVIASSFSQSLNCTAVVAVSGIVATGSLALLITGILGVKAYKCLNNSRLVLAILALFQCASGIIVLLDTVATRGDRRLTGSCVRISNLFYTRIVVWIQLLESLFICCCFMYACWKSRGSSAARGRISLQLSIDDMPIEVPTDTSDRPNNLRGWWDYIPDKIASPTIRQLDPTKHKSFKGVRTKLKGILKQDQKKRRVSPPYPREKVEDDKFQDVPSNPSSPVTRATSPAPTTGSRFGKFVPSIHLFQRVVKDELLYTTSITATCVVVAVLAAIGLNSKNGLTVTGWIDLNWAVISLLTIHSFSRVVGRHERDALLRQTFSSNTFACGTRARRQPKSEMSTISIPSSGRETEFETDNPFTDSHHFELRSSWSSNESGASREHPSSNPFDDTQSDNIIPNPFADISLDRSSMRSSEALLGRHYDERGSTLSVSDGVEKHEKNEAT
ncbi:hypothetical protein H0H93_002830 [Arthromyces matolae]|nr:hypothetical protein H0H93_002830 [Arthromyces matolae]